MYCDLSYQISLFGDLNFFEPTQERIKETMDKLSSFNLLPSIFKEQSLVLNPEKQFNQLNIVNRLQMTAAQGNLNLMFSTNRLDISTSIVNSEDKLNEAKFKQLIEIYNKLNLEFKFSRVAFNSISLINNSNLFSEKILKSSLDCFVNPHELSIRVNKRRKLIPSMDSGEDFNLILTIQKLMSNLFINQICIPSERGLICQFDINSLAENQEPRFDFDKANAYFNEAYTTKGTILDDFLK